MVTLDSSVCRRVFAEHRLSESGIRVQTLAPDLESAKRSVASAEVADQPCRLAYLSDHWTEPQALRPSALLAVGDETVREQQHHDEVRSRADN